MPRHASPFAQSCRCPAEPRIYEKCSPGRTFHKDLPKQHEGCFTKGQNQLTLVQGNLGSMKAPCHCNAAKEHALEDSKPHCAP